MVKAIPDPQVIVQNLNFWYGDQQALFDISLEIMPRQITALIGPSGCGKSTFLRILNRLCDLIPETLVKGSVLIDGEDIFAKKLDLIELRKTVGMVFQKPNPFPKSIYDNVAYGPRLHGMSEKDVADRVEVSLRKAYLFDEVKDRLKSSAMALSGGQQQRLCIARALAVEPKILLMDEPTSALDPTATKRVEHLVEELKEQYTIIIVTHNMQQAARVSDMTGFFLQGQLVEMGHTEELFTNPKNKQTEAYITGRFG